MIDWVYRQLLRILLICYIFTHWCFYPYYGNNNGGKIKSKIGVLIYVLIVRVIYSHSGAI